MAHAVGKALLVLLFLAGAFGCDSGAEEALPAPPTMVFPVNGATDQDNALELQWTPVSDAESYHVQVSSAALGPRRPLMPCCSLLRGSPSWLRGTFAMRRCLTALF